MKYIANILLLSLLLVACGREESSTYEVPKSQAAPAGSVMGSQADNALVTAAHATMSANEPSSGFSADLPEGWTEKAGSGMRKVSYSIDGTSIDFYLISLSMGDVPSNVNRWRGQVGLANATPEEISKDLETFKVATHDVNYIEIYNEEGGKGIIAAIVDLAPQYWYFTAKGSVVELKANAANISTFLKSIKIEGHNH